MGVHNTSQYREIKRLLEIPDSEPIFIIRGQDILAHPTLEAYEGLAEDNDRSPEFLADLRQVRSDFETWHMENKDSMKMPD
jgi:hypothetical protein